MKLFAAVLLPALLLPSTTVPARQHPAAQAAQYTYQGTVQTVQAGARSFALITGVGLALRVVHIQAAPTARIQNAGTAISLGDLKPGDVVRAECRRTEAGIVADHIEKLRRAS